MAFRVAQLGGAYLTKNDHRALVAKEIIALANHGGGYFVIGFEKSMDGSFKAAQPRLAPADLHWNQLLPSRCNAVLTQSCRHRIAAG
jgi:hypothetical protein